jgi:hypothetical protein
MFRHTDKLYAALNHSDIVNIIECSHHVEAIKSLLLTLEVPA